MADTSGAEEKLVGAIEALAEQAMEQAGRLGTEDATKSARRLAEALTMVAQARDVGQGQAARDHSAGVEDLRDHRHPLEVDDVRDVAGDQAEVGGSTRRDER